MLAMVRLCSRQRMLVWFLKWLIGGSRMPFGVLDHHVKAVEVLTAHLLLRRFRVRVGWLHSYAWVLASNNFRTFFILVNGSPARNGLQILSVFHPECSGLLHHNANPNPNLTLWPRVWTWHHHPTILQRVSLTLKPISNGLTRSFQILVTAAKRHGW